MTIRRADSHFDDHSLDPGTGVAGLVQLGSDSVTVRSILIIQTKFIGDIVLTSALVANLRMRYPGVRIVFLCTRGLDTFVKAHGIADETLAIDRARMRRSPLGRASETVSMVRALRRMKFDMSIDITDSKTSRLLSGLVIAPVKIGYSPTEHPLRLLERQPANLFAKPYGIGDHYLDRYLSPLDALGFKVEVPSPSIKPLPEKNAAALELLQSVGLVPSRFIAVHAGASFAGRRWQPERFAAALDELVARTGLAVALVGGPDERELTASVRSMMTRDSVDLAGRSGLDVLLAVLANARLFIGNESGPMHMAAAAGTPVVGLFGLTDPARWGPVGTPSMAVRPSMPCTCIAPGLCRSHDPSKAFCVQRIEVIEVVAAAIALLDKIANEGRAADL